MLHQSRKKEFKGSERIWCCGDSRIMTGSFSSVPAVNYARLTNPETKSDELNKLREAIFVVGFLYLTNTGLEVCLTGKM